ncbi:MAG: allophanate hydrolase [Azospirillum sp.]|nr:allophanate hydrolase [Azospirillum sp.]
MSPQPFLIASLHSRYAAGSLSAAEVVALACHRIAAAEDPGIFLHLVPREQALAAARALPNFDPERYPLWGIPFAVKDNIDVAGLPTTAACPDFAYVPQASAPAVDRLLSAGAILIGKTNLDQFATGLVGVRTPYPVPRNALDPALVPGGSSSGSAVAVARGLVAFALGTDTAGSGRIPAGLNNVVGLKPSLGAVSTRGVVPACRTLDCISVFSGCVDDAWRVLTTMAGPDSEDPFSRPVGFGPPEPPAPVIRVGVPRAADLRFFGDSAGAAAWADTLTLLEAQGAEPIEVDFTPLFAAAALLYDGPWIAERHQALRRVLAETPEAMLPVTRGIVERAGGWSASDCFAALYRLKALALTLVSIWQKVEILAVPTLPIAPTLSEVAAEPILLNSRLGSYTNFVNLLDLCALAVPGPGRRDGRPAGVSLIGPRGADARLAGFGARLHHAAGVAIGATGWPVPEPLPRSAAAETIEVVVVGAHLSGMALNGELRAQGGHFVRAVPTAPCYRLYALPGGPPHRPGLVRVAPDTGFAIETEVWALPPASFGGFVGAVPAPLSIGTVRLADDTAPKGFLCEAIATAGAVDISHLGGWRAYIAGLALA